MYLSGYLHRDPSLGNVMIISDDQEGLGGEEFQEKEFEIPEEFLKTMDSWKNQDTVKKIKEQCDRVKRLVVELGIPATHSAVILDGDLAVTWGDYWTENRRLAESVSDLLVT